MIRELKTLIAVAREGTFAAAGNKIGLTQAAVSAQMQRLEQELGLKLFDRVGRTAELNQAGRQVLDQSREIIDLYSNLGITALQNTQQSPINIGAISSVQRSTLPEAIQHFQKSHPHSRIRIIPGLSIELLDQVDSGEIDMAILVRPPLNIHSDLEWITLEHEPFKLIVPNNVQETDWMAILTTYPFIRYDRTSYGGRLVDKFLKKALIKVQDKCEVDELDAIVKLVAYGVGVALVPQTRTHTRWPAGVREISLEHYAFSREIGIVFHRNALQKDRLHSLLTEITSIYEK